MTHVMIDAETLGLTPNSVVLNFAMVSMDFERAAVEPEIYDSGPISINSCQKFGLKIDGNTIDWWLTRSPDAIKALGRSNSVHRSLQVVAKEALEWLSLMNKNNNLRVWGNSARFDLGLMDNVALRAGLKLPWDYRKEMCYRTIASLYPESPRNRLPEGEAHIALNDAKSQAEHLLMLNGTYDLRLEKI